MHSCIPKAIVEFDQRQVFYVLLSTSVFRFTINFFLNFFSLDAEQVLMAKKNTFDSP